MKTDKPNVGVGYGNLGKPVLVYEGFREWIDTPEALEVREAGSTTDFAYYLDTIIRKVFFDRYQRAESGWRKFAKTMSVSDYREITSVSLSGMPLLLKVGEGGEYKDSPLDEIPGPKIKIEKFGRLFSLTREVFINDDLNRLNDVPSMMAEAAVTSINVNVVQSVLENPGNAYDGNPFFDNTTHGNAITDALSEIGLQNAITKLRQQKDDKGYRINVRPGMLVVPVELEFIAARILNSTEVHIQGGTAATPAMGSTPLYSAGNANTVRGIVDYWVEPYLTDANDWYLFADPNAAGARPAMQVAFLNGQETPQVMLKNPEVRLLLGGAGNSDPYTMLYDEIWWKVRYEWAARMWEWRSAVKATVT